MTEQDFPAGHVFFRAGDAGELAYLLHAGQVEILSGPAELPRRIALFGPGEVFGEMALLEERPRALMARAVAAGRATAMTRDEFEHLLTHDPARTRQYLRSIFERLRLLTVRFTNEAEPVNAQQEASTSHAGPREIPHETAEPATWVVVVHALSRKAAVTLPDEGLRVTRFPMRIGRATSANEPEAFDLNDVWLLDAKPYNVSRNHCEILVDEKGALILDRGSHLGCYVNDKHIGGQATVCSARLSMGDNVLVLGAPMSPYQFRVNVSRV